MKIITQSCWSHITIQLTNFSWLSFFVALIACPPFKLCLLESFSHCANTISTMWSLDWIRVFFVYSSTLIPFLRHHTCPHSTTCRNFDHLTYNFLSRSLEYIYCLVPPAHILDLFRKIWCSFPSNFFLLETSW